MHLHVKFSKIVMKVNCGPKDQEKGTPLQLIIFCRKNLSRFIVDDLMCTVSGRVLRQIQQYRSSQETCLLDVVVTPAIRTGLLEKASTRQT